MSAQPVHSTGCIPFPLDLREEGVKPVDARAQKMMQLFLIEAIEHAVFNLTLPEKLKAQILAANNQEKSESNEELEGEVFEMDPMTARLLGIYQALKGLETQENIKNQLKTFTLEAQAKQGTKRKEPEPSPPPFGMYT